MEKISNLMKSLIEKRVEDICNEVSTEAWYQILQEKIIQTRHCILNETGGNLKALLNDYDSLCCKIHSITTDKIYAQAYKDGAETKSI